MDSQKILIKSKIFRFLYHDLYLDLVHHCPFLRLSQSVQIKKIDSIFVVNEKFDGCIAPKKHALLQKKHALLQKYMHCSERISGGRKMNKNRPSGTKNKQKTSQGDEK